MILEYAITAAIALAFVLQVAVDRGPDVLDSRDSKSARRVLIAGLFIMLLHMLQVCYEGRSVLSLLYVGLLLLALAEIAFCVNRLFPKSLLDITSMPLQHDKSRWFDGR